MSNVSNFQKDCIQFTLSLYNNTNIPRNAIDDIVNLFKKFISDSYIPHLQNTIATELIDTADRDIINSVNSTLDELKNPFHCLNTEHLRFKQYEKYCGFSTPEPYEIGINVTFEIVSYLEIRVKHEKVYGVFMPVKNALQNLLEKPGLFNEITNYMKTLKEEVVISNVMQGRLWKEKYCVKSTENEIVLPIFLFYDDFETGNTLGSHAGQQELGGIYMSLPFLPPHLVAKLSNIFVAAIFYSKHRKCMDSEAVCQKVIQEINKLSTEGLSLQIGDSIVKVSFRCVLLLGDNLGVNCICGFVKSFSAIRYCRICRATIIECQRMVEEKKNLLRTKENYKRDVQSRSIRSGIHTQCVFNNLVDFHITENRSLDIMHDLFEGVVKYTISRVLTCLIFTDQLFSLETLNHRILTFHYGEAERNKPCPVERETTKPNKNDKVQNKIRMKQSSAEMLCLSRYLGVIIGDLIPSHNVYWELYIILRQIIGIVTAPRFNLADVSNLRLLIRKHNEMYVDLFGLLKPKMHFMLHLPEVMLDNGPAIHFWSMPFERKNKELKEIAVSTRCYKNVPLTIGIRYQLRESFSKVTDQKVEKHTFLGSIENDKDSYISNFMPRIKYAKSYKYVEIYGNKLTCGSIIIIDINDSGIEFGRIIKIYNILEEIYFLVSEIENLCFDYHLYAYKVILHNEPHAIINIKMLPNAGSCTICRVKTSDFIVTRYDV